MGNDAVVRGAVNGREKGRVSQSSNRRATIWHVRSDPILRAHGLLGDGYTPRSAI